jgi:hypothetical protein
VILHTCPRVHALDRVFGHPGSALRPRQQVSLSRREADVAVRLVRPNEAGSVTRKVGTMAFGLIRGYARTSWRRIREEPAAHVPASTRNLSSFPALKKGTDFASTETIPPFRGLRPTRGPRRLTVNAPKRRNSTRSPCASADAMPSRMVATTVSTSSARRCALAVAISAISSDLVKTLPAINSRDVARWIRLGQT